MVQKTTVDRDRIHVELRLKQAALRRQKVAIVNEWVEVHGTVPEWLWNAFGHAEFMRGYNDGVREASFEE